MSCSRGYTWDVLHTENQIYLLCNAFLVVKINDILMYLLLFTARLLMKFVTGFFAVADHAVHYIIVSAFLLVSL